MLGLGAMLALPAAGARADVEPEPTPATTESETETETKTGTEAPEPTEPTEPTPTEPTPTEPEPTAMPTGPVDASVGLPVIDDSSLEGPMVEDGVLPCGLRVIVARDATLPVAAVVLAVDTGTEDDPPAQPGLVHALAYHLLQGNRELTPGGAAALVQDSGGLTTLSVGPAQVRYESLVPISALDDVLWAESQRLRAPSVSEALWSDTLRWARRDGSLRWRPPRAAMAAAHGVPGLEHDGRTVTPPLEQMVPRAVGQALAERFRYTVATLVVVSPHDPAKLRDAIAEHFEDLPAAPRRPRDRTPRWRPGSVPQALPVAGESGGRFVWPVGPTPAEVAHATVFCKAINRQRRAPAEPGRGRLRCHLDLDPRRSTMVLVATGVDDPLALLRQRIDRLERGDDDELVELMRASVLHELVQQVGQPLPLARQLSGAAPRPSLDPGFRPRPQAALTGLAELSTSWTGRRFGPRLSPGAAIHLVAPEPPPP